MSVRALSTETLLRRPDSVTESRAEAAEQSCASFHAFGVTA
ncbi:MAG: hypothetical protein R2748_29605 [Bryobacterales bacterium]